MIYVRKPIKKRNVSRSKIHHENSRLRFIYLVLLDAYFIFIFGCCHLLLLLLLVFETVALFGSHEYLFRVKFMGRIFFGYDKPLFCGVSAIN